MGPIRSYLNEHAILLEDFNLEPKSIARVIELIDAKEISNSMAVQKLFPLMLKDPLSDALEIAEVHDLIHHKEENVVIEFVKTVLKDNPAEVERYKNGEKKLMGFFMGQLMKLTKGKVEPKAATEALKNKLEKYEL